MRGKWLLVAPMLGLFANTAVAHAADPGRWTETGRNSVPLYYYQGISSDPANNMYFDGVDFGLYKTDPQLNQLAGHDDEIPPDVHQREGYDHMGDLTWDAQEGGRVILPLECYYPYPGAPNNGNTCGTGSFGVADDETLDWKYYVKLDERDIPKAMWAEVSPDGTLVWTSSGKDLLAYSTADIKPANAAPDGPKIRPVRRLAGAVPASGITGAAFEGDRMLVAGQDSGPFQVWSIDLTNGSRRLEIERAVVGESEGIDIADVLGGHLHWLIQPYNEQSIPTYGVTNGTILNFKPAAGTSTPTPTEPSAPQPAAQQPRARIKLTIRPRRVVAGRMTRFRIRTTAKGQPVARASVHFAGRLVRTDDRGRATMNARLRKTGRRHGRASHAGLRKGHTSVFVRSAPAK